MAHVRRVHLDYVTPDGFLCASAPMDPGYEPGPTDDFPQLEAGCYLTFIVDGDSMDDGTENGLRRGDALEVDPGDKELRVNKVFAVSLLGHGDVVKRVRSIDGLLWLTSDNPAHPSFRVDEAKIIGRVVSKVRRTRL